MATRKRAPKWVGPWLTTKQAADHLGLSVEYLKRRRQAGDGPPCRKVENGREWRYPLDGLNAWANGEP